MWLASTRNPSFIQFRFLLRAAMKQSVQSLRRRQPTRALPRSLSPDSVDYSIADYYGFQITSPHQPIQPRAAPERASGRPALHQHCHSRHCLLTIFVATGRPTREGFTRVQGLTSRTSRSQRADSPALYIGYPDLGQTPLPAERPTMGRGTDDAR